MMSTYTNTASYTETDIVDVIRRLGTDLSMIAESTGAWTTTQVADRKHDIELLAKKGYLAWVDVTFFDGEVEENARKWVVDTEAGSLTTSRPGDVMWPRVDNPKLRMTIGHTSAYDAAAEQALSDKFKLKWSTSTRDLSHSTLTSGGGRSYTSNGYGLTRKDWN